MAQQYELKLTMDNGSQISAGTIDIPDGPTGPSGAPGEDALTYNGSISLPSNPSTSSAVMATLNAFNRTPVVGDTFVAMGLINNIPTNDAYIGVFKVTSVSSPVANCSISSLSKITGTSYATLTAGSVVTTLSQVPNVGTTFTVNASSFNRQLVNGDKLIFAIYTQTTYDGCQGPYLVQASTNGALSSNNYTFTIDAVLSAPALEYYLAPVLQSVPSTVTNYSASISGFNRTPLVGETVKLNVIVKGTLYSWVARVSSVNTGNGLVTLNGCSSAAQLLAPSNQLYRHIITGTIYDEDGTNAELMMSVISNVGTQADTWDQVGNVLMLSTNGITSVPGRVTMNSTYYTIQSLRRLSDKIDIETSANGTMKKFQILNVASLMDIVTTL